MSKEIVDIIVEGGKASAGPQMGQAFGPLGINIQEILDKINEKTSSMKGMKIPVKVRSLLKKNHFCNTMAVEIMSLHDDYMYLLDSLTPGDIQIKLPEKTREKVFA